jgi:hypothetical protein
MLVPSKASKFKLSLTIKIGYTQNVSKKINHRAKAGGSIYIEPHRTR